MKKKRGNVHKWVKEFKQSQTLKKPDKLDALIDSLNFDNLEKLTVDVKSRLADFNNSTEDDNRINYIKFPEKSPNEARKKDNGITAKRSLIQECYALNEIIHSKNKSKQKKIEIITNILEKCQHLEKFMLLYQIIYDNEKILNEHENPRGDRFFGIKNTDSWRFLLTALKAKGEKLLKNTLDNDASLCYSQKRAIANYAIQNPITTAHRNNHWWQGAFGTTATTKRFEKWIETHDKTALRADSEDNYDIPVFRSS